MFHMNCLLKHITEETIVGMIDVMGRQRRSKLILGELRDIRGFWKLKEETLDCILWRMCF